MFALFCVMFVLGIIELLVCEVLEVGQAGYYYQIRGISI